MRRWFSEDMTSAEAIRAFCCIPKEELIANKDEIIKEKAEVMSIIYKREFREARELEEKTGIMWTDTIW